MNPQESGESKGPQSEDPSKKAPTGCQTGDLRLKRPDHPNDVDNAPVESTTDQPAPPVGEPVRLPGWSHRERVMRALVAFDEKHNSKKRRSRTDDQRRMK